MVDFIERITVNHEQCSGRPCIRGMRIRVIDILSLLASGLTALCMRHKDWIIQLLRYDFVVK